MFKFAIIKLKDLIKYLVIIIVIVFTIYMIKRYFFDNEKFDLENINLSSKIANMVNSAIVNSLNTEIPVINENYTENSTEEKLIDENEENADEEFMSQLFISLIETELSAVNLTTIQNADIDTQIAASDGNSEDVESTENNGSDEELELAETDVTTEVVTENPLSDSSTDTYNDVKIKNETDFELTDEILNPDSLDIDTSNIIIFHTHTCESYTSSEKYSYTATGNYRTTDLNYTVARVGDELTSYLTKYGFNVTHDKTYHDYPSYSGSYTRSLETVSDLLEEDDADIIIDLHRDAIGSYSSYAPTVKIGDDYCAQIMFVMGTNGGGLYHPNWQSNLKFAVKIQEVAESLYPGLCKPIILRDSRYNQHLGKAACIIEVGATGNTLEQCLNSMKYLSEVMNVALNGD